MINYAAEDKEFTFYQRNGIIKKLEKSIVLRIKMERIFYRWEASKNHEKVVIPARSIITLVTQ